MNTHLHTKPNKWHTFPTTYRTEQINQILHWIRLGESGIVIGGSGAGKSNVAGFLAHRSDVTSQLLPGTPENYCFLHLDINSLPKVTTASFYRSMLYTLQAAIEATPELHQPVAQLLNRLNSEMAGDDEQLALYFALQKAHDLLINHAGKQVIWLIDRFDEACKKLEAGTLNSLRSLRDQFKDQLSYIVFTRYPLERLRELAEIDEFHELMALHRCWVGRMNGEDARWVAQQVFKRYGKSGDAETIARLIDLAGGWPALIKVLCSAWAGGTLNANQTAPMIDQLLSLIAVQRNYQELWNDCTVEEQALLQSLAQGMGRLPSTACVSESLLNYGLIEPDGDKGGLHITSPLFAAFIRQQQKGTGRLALHGNLVYREGVEVTSLTPLEARLLAGLLQTPGVAWSKEQLIQHLFEQQADGSQDDRLAQLVKRPRQKIEPAVQEWNYIQNLHGVGYRLNQPN